MISDQKQKGCAMIKIKAFMKWYVASPAIEMVFCAIWVVILIFYAILGNWAAAFAYLLVITYSLVEVARLKLNHYAEIAEKATG
jgi:hypothetical protein